jgi:malate dehydrogenase
VASVTNVAIWGNHSATQVPDYANALIDGKPATEVIDDTAWLQGDFLTTVQKRGAAIIEARGLSSAASAANAAVDSVVSIRTGTPGDDFTSLAVVSNGEYGVPEGLQFGFPVRTNGSGDWTVVEGLAHDEFAADRIRITTEELQAERADVADLLP